MLPLIAGMAAGGALNAGVKGAMDLASQEEREKQAKAQALQSLSSKFQSEAGSQHQFNTTPNIPKPQSFGEAVVAPMASAAAGGAMSAGLSGLGKPSAPTAAPAADPHADYEQGFDASMKKPAADPFAGEEDFYAQTRGRLGGR